jgi:uncharacterized protein (DUF2249 family)
MEQRLDVSALEPPEPLERILDALADLPAGDWLRVRHRREPYPLYGMLRNMHYHWHTRSHGPDDFEILIWPATLGPAPPPC